MIPFIDLNAQQKLILDKINKRINQVLDHGQYILGPEVKELEDRLSSFAGCKYVLCCSSGTDALLLGLIALGLKPGEAVIVPSFTFALKLDSLPINLKAALQKFIPAIIPFCLAIIFAFDFLFLKLIKFVVISPLGFKSSSKAFLTTELIYF